jgi:RimJ/RimL family protein N-acetyltransferase
MLWGIDWSTELPVDAGNGVTVVSSTYDECLPFVREHYAAIFEEDGTSPFTMTREGPLKERYYRLAGDFFAFKDGDRTVGLMVGTAADWSSYYIRSAAIVPEYAGKQIVHGFLPWLFRALKRAGIERVEADTSPSNFAVLGILTKLAFNVTGTVLTDRWGAHVHLTKHLADDREDVFLRQYCAGVRYQLRGRSMTNDPTPPERSSP